MLKGRSKRSEMPAVILIPSQAAQAGFVQPQAQGNPGYVQAPAPQPAPGYGPPQGYGAQGRIPPQAPQAQGWNGTGPSYQPQPPQGWNGQH